MNVPFTEFWFIELCVERSFHITRTLFTSAHLRNFFGIIQRTALPYFTNTDHFNAKIINYSNNYGPKSMKIGQNILHYMLDEW